tara:strand:- start:124 stop:669 length:546 start_codon:yes stop_codon:yes gene_type:complete
MTRNETINSSCVICNGEGFEYEQVDDKREKRPCPCDDRAYAEHIITATSKPQTYREQVASGLIDEEITLWDLPSPSAKDLADEGIARVVANVTGDEETEAIEEIYSELLALIDLQPFAFSADDLASRCKGKGLYEKLHSTNLIGSLFRRAKSEKRIQSTGRYISSEQPQSHGRPLMVWVKK